MNTNIKRPFHEAQIEIEIINHDVLTVSGFFGEDDEFPKSWREYNGE